MSCEKIFLIAGEASGDQHAADLVRNLKLLNQDLRVYAVGGDGLKRAGARIIVRSSELSVVGAVEVLHHIRPILKAYRRVVSWLESERPSLLVLVDFPEFNLLIAKKAKALGIPVFYFISPQIWAWRQGRVRKIKRLVNRMAVILPFEKDFYRNYGIDVEFVGHPLLDSVKPRMSREEFFNKFSIPGSARLVCLLPGSRSGEIRRHLNLFLKTAGKISRQHPGCSFCLPLAPGLSGDIERFINKRVKDFAESSNLEVHIVRDSAHDAMAASDLVIAASGTVTLEAAILRVPMIVTYRLAPLTYFAGRLLVRVKWVSLVNLIAGRQVVPEILQDKAIPENLSDQALRLLEDQEARTAMIRQLDEIVGLLGKPGAAHRAASLVQSMLMETHADKA